MCIVFQIGLFVRMPPALGWCLGVALFMCYKVKATHETSLKLREFVFCEWMCLLELRLKGIFLSQMRIWYEKGVEKKKAKSINGGINLCLCSDFCLLVERLWASQGSGQGSIR